MQRKCPRCGRSAFRKLYDSIYGCQYCDATSMKLRDGSFRLRPDYEWASDWAKELFPEDGTVVKSPKFSNKIYMRVKCPVCGHSDAKQRAADESVRDIYTTIYDCPECGIFDNNDLLRYEKKREREAESQLTAWELRVKRMCEDSE